MKEQASKNGTKNEIDHKRQVKQEAPSEVSMSYTPQ
jgi:hypothetical protein